MEGCWGLRGTGAALRRPQGPQPPACTLWSCCMPERTRSGMPGGPRQTPGRRLSFGGCVQLHASPCCVSTSWREWRCKESSYTCGLHHVHVGPRSTFLVGEELAWQNEKLCADWLKPHRQPICDPDWAPAFAAYGSGHPGAHSAKQQSGRRGVDTSAPRACNCSTGAECQSSSCTEIRPGGCVASSAVEQGTGTHRTGSVAADGGRSRGRGH